MLYRLFLFFMLCSSSMILTVFTTTLVTSAAALINCTNTSFFAFNRLLLWNSTQEMTTTTRTTTKKRKSSGNDDDAQEHEAFEDSYQLNESSLEYSDVDRMAPAQEDQIEQLLDGSNDGDAAAIQRQEQEPYPGRAEQQASTAAATFLLRHHQQHDAEFYRARFFRSRVSGNGPRQSNVFIRRRIDPWKLELYYNFKYAPFWLQMRSLLRNWVDNRGFQPQIMQRLIDDVKVPIDSSNNNNNRKQAVEDNVENEITENDAENFSSSSSSSSSSTTRTMQKQQQQRRSYNSCAVVGNSGILLNSTYGAFIDSHEMVMRINNAKIKGFKRFVGAKTSIAFMNSHILRVCAHSPQCRCHPYGVEVPIVVYLCQPWHFMPVAFCSKAHSAPLLVTDPRFDNLCNRIAKWYSVKLFMKNKRPSPKASSQWSNIRNAKQSFHYSSGMQAVVMALGMCKSVNIFGFGKPAGAKHHYHSLQKQELVEIHDYEAEYHFYRDLERNHTQVIPFFTAAGISTLPAFKIFL
ncbi:unnamed protein product [Sphagnum troendelagicum]|uniref:Sialyltransferase-like protein n=1 Tax=Sphagnum troendelagicum TaxID=128251 RepID=A0ABP0TS31_9BRYO